MKKILFLICTTFVCVSVLCATNVHMSLTRSSLSSSLVTTISDNNLYYMTSLSLSQSSLKLKVPPCFSLSTSGWYIGEIKPSGIFSYLVDSSNKALDVKDSKAFQKVVSPSINPSYSGLAKSSPNADFAVLTPIFAPSSPLGFYADLHGNHWYSGLLFVDFKSNGLEKLQVDWDSQTDSGTKLYTIIGFNNSIKRQDFYINMDSFVQSVYKSLYGLTGTVGWNAKLSNKNTSFNMFNRLSNNDLSEPINTVGYEITIPHLTVSYKYKNYCKPSYGGTSQKKSAELVTTFTYSDFYLKTNSQLTLDEDTGKTGLTEYTLGYEKDSTSITFDLALNRVTDTPLSVKKLSFEAKLDQMKFCVNNAKYSIEIHWIDELQIADQLVILKYSVNQDRRYTLSASMLL